MSSFAGKLGGASGGTSALPIKLSEVSIKPEDFIDFAKISVGIISFFSSMIISLISRGDIKSGIKYIPVFVIVSVVNLSIFMWLLGSMFSFIAF